MEHTFFPKKSRFVLWVFIGAVVITLNLLFIFSVKLVYKEPQFNQFCKDSQITIIPETEEECATIGGLWSPDRFLQKTLPRPGQLEPSVIEQESKGYCDPSYMCGSEFGIAKTRYERNTFVILFVFGVLALSAGYLLRAHEVVAIAIFFGGVVQLIFASARYWGEMSDFLRVVLLGITLLILLWIGLKKFSK